MVTLVSLLEKGLVSTFSEPDSMNSIIEGLTKCVLIPHSCSAKELRSDEVSQSDEPGSRSRQQDFFSKIAVAPSP